MGSSKKGSQKIQVRIFGLLSTTERCSLNRLEWRLELFESRLDRLSVVLKADSFGFYFGQNALKAEFLSKVDP